MGNKSQLFQIQDTVSRYNERCKSGKKKKKQKDPEEKKKEMAAAVSLSHFDDGAPIILSGSAWYHSFSQSVAEAPEQIITEDATFSVIEDDGEDEYSINKELLLLSQSSSESEYDTVLSLTENTEEPGLHDWTANAKREESQASLSDSEIAADLSTIFSTTENKEPAPNQAEKDDFWKKMMDKNEEQKTASPTTDEAATVPPTSGNQNIFDAIAKSLNYANAFDLGNYVLEQRFDMFDEEENKRISGESNMNKSELATRGEPVRTGHPGGQAAKVSSESEELSTRAFLEDLDSIQQSSEAFGVKVVDKTTKDWPAAPADLVQPTVAITKQLFGTFEYENIPNASNCEVRIKGNWESTNIENVTIPQLKGVANGSAGYIRFNKKASKQLQRLWKAWEDAGLLDRIITYDGGFVPRYKKLKGGGCATSLSNHAWGSAFDINAQWNALGAEPALLGKKGCTRELVEIAAQHGFYWGGHFSNKDGMHFEVAKIIE